MDRELCPGEAVSTGYRLEQEGLKTEEE